jgi:hypothetical protein
VVANAPAVVKDVRKRAELLYTHPGRFPEFTGHALAGRGARVRARRSSRREAVALVLDALAARWDRRTNRCGSPRGDRRDSALCPSVEELAAETGMSEPRVGRAVAELHRARYLESKRVVEGYDAGNRYCGLPSVRVLTPLLFRRLGITEKKLLKAQGQGAAAWQKKRGPLVSAVGVQKVRRELQHARPGSKFTPAPLAAPAPRLDPAERLLRVAAALGVPPDKR